MRPPHPHYNFTWRVSTVLDYLKTLFPSLGLTLKMLTLKLVALLALSSVTRAQTLVSMNIDSMEVFEDRVIFVFHELQKTADWSLVKNSKKYYLREVSNSEYG